MAGQVLRTGSVVESRQPYVLPELRVLPRRPGGPTVGEGRKRALDWLELVDPVPDELARAVVAWHDCQAAVFAPSAAVAKLASEVPSVLAEASQAWFRRHRADLTACRAAISKALDAASDELLEQARQRLSDAMDAGHEGQFASALRLSAALRAAGVVDRVGRGDKAGRVALDPGNPLHYMRRPDLHHDAGRPPLIVALAAEHRDEWGIEILSAQEVVDNQRTIRRAIADAWQAEQALRRSIT